MEHLTVELQQLINDSNKPQYDSLYSLVAMEFENALQFTDTQNMSDMRLKTMGSCGIYISSIVELLYTTRDLLDKGFVESGGTVAAALWERALTLRKILIDPINNSEVHTYHKKAKKSPWSVWQMVTAVVEKDHQKNPHRDRDTDAKLMYLQYTFLSSIKHGNPYTISYLNRPDRSSKTDLFAVKANDSVRDRDLRIYIMLLAADISLTALLEYSNEFRTNSRTVQEVRDFADQIIPIIPLNVPQILTTTVDEMGEDFWNYLVSLHSEPVAKL